MVLRTSAHQKKLMFKAWKIPPPPPLRREGQLQILNMIPQCLGFFFGQIQLDPSFPQFFHSTPSPHQAGTLRPTRNRQLFESALHANCFGIKNINIFDFFQKQWYLPQNHKCYKSKKICSAECSPWAPHLFTGGGVIFNTCKACLSSGLFSAPAAGLAWEWRVPGTLF